MEIKDSVSSALRIAVGMAAGGSTLSVYSSSKVDAATYQRGRRIEVEVRQCAAADGSESLGLSISVAASLPCQSMHEACDLVMIWPSACVTMVAAVASVL